MLLASHTSSLTPWRPVLLSVHHFPSSPLHSSPPLVCFLQVREIAASALWRLAQDDKILADLAPDSRRVDLGDGEKPKQSFRAATRAAGAVPLLEHLARCGNMETEVRARKALKRIQAWFH